MNLQLTERAEAATDEATEGRGVARKRGVLGIFENLKG